MKSNPLGFGEKPRAALSQQLMPWLLAGSLGLGGGGFAATGFKSAAVTPDQLEQHMTRLVDKIDGLDSKLERLDSRLQHVEKDLADLKYQDRSARIKWEDQ